MKKNHAITHSIVYTATRLEAIANRFVFGPMGTTAASMKILGLLREHGPLEPNRIVELGGGTKSNVSQRLGYLEKNGYVRRGQDVFPDDLRKVIVKITARGEKRIAEIRKRMKQAQICLANHFTSGEIEQHKQFFEKINRIIDKEEKSLAKIFKKSA